MPRMCRAQIGCRIVLSGHLCPELAATQPIERDATYRRRRFPREVIEGCVRWYLTYRLSYRDLVELMTQLPIDHWVEVIGDPVIADATRDRLEQAALTINITGESYRGV